MGFYGNITNTSRTTFAFDKVYTSRWEMDKHRETDGIYAGRYVLVNYENGTASEDTFNGTTYCYDTITGEPVMYAQLSVCGDSSSNGVTASSAVSSMSNTYASGSSSTSATFTHFNYTGPVEATKLTVSNVSDGDIYKINIGNHVKNVSQQTFYIKITDNSNLSNVEYEYVEKEDYFDCWNLTEESSDDEDIHVHIINSVVYFQDATKASVGNVFIVPVGYKYDANNDPELWSAEVVNSILTWKQIDTSSSNYLQNFNYDKAFYGVSRGYDSTVWQKVYSSGQETYVMVAELNTVVPTFEVSADAPSIVPIAPHFDTSSTNVYYKFHWQPQWGLRVKSANSSFTGPQIKQDGTINNNAKILLRDTVADGVIYPSDEKVVWKTTFYDTATDSVKVKYYSPEAGGWVDTPGDTTSLQAAIYYNAAGFDKDKISYSQDYLDTDTNIKKSGWENVDEIAITPTGLSGNVYNKHENSIDLESKVDTQEMKIMLPSLGDTVAHIWDLTYGGRDTDEIIKKSNKRNTDISWENGITLLNRPGLRLVPDTTDTRYNKSQVNTIAGSINSVHDLMGMIIIPIDTNESPEDFIVLEDKPNIVLRTEAANSYDINKIYYNTYNKEYYRKHKTYDYDETEIKYIYNPIDYNVSADTFNEGIFYEKTSSGEYTPAKSYTSGAHYYERILSPESIYTAIPPVNDDSKVSGFTEYINGKYWYQEYTGNLQVTNKNLYDYIMYPTYTENKSYYTVTTSACDLAGHYEKDKYYQFIEDKDTYAYSLDRNSVPYQNSLVQYCTIDENEVVSIKDCNFEAIYVPDVYYYYEPSSEDTDTIKKGSYILDTGLTPEEGKAHYRLKPSQSNAIRYVKDYKYIPVSLDSQSYKPNTYYTSETGGEVATGEKFDETLIYYKQVEIYRPATKDEDLTYNIDSKTPISNFILFTDNTFYTRKYDTDGKTIIGYKLQTLESVTSTILKYYSGENVDETEMSYYAFGVRKTQNTSYITYSFFDSEKNEPYNEALKYLTTFYEPNKYHYVVEDGAYAGSIKLDTNEFITSGRKYYTINAEEVKDVLFYQSYKYYIGPSATIGEDGKTLTYDGDLTDTDNFLIATQEKPNSSYTYYIKNGIYVKEDSANILTTGAEWNINAQYVPATLTLALRKEKYELIPLEGYSRTVNTMNGLLMKINQALESGDNLTREYTSAAGVNNQVKDIIARFGTIRTNEIPIVDDYGRIRSSAIETQQNEYNLDGTKSLPDSPTDMDVVVTYRQGISKDIFPKAETVDDMENQWITLNVDGSVEHPLITIHHNYQTVQDNDDLTADKNNIEKVETTEGFNNDGYGDHLKLYTPIVDKTGHVVGSNKETVTLPYGFKILNTTALVTNAASDLYTTIVNEVIDSNKNVTTAETSSATTSGTVTEAIADKTQDTLKINPVNKWVQIKMTNGDSNEGTIDTIEVAHEIHAIDRVTQFTNKNIDSLPAQTDADKITVQDLKFDAAGHVTQNREHTYVLPFGFKNLNLSSISNDGVQWSQTAGVESSSGETTTQIVADNTQDTLNFATGNKWIRLQTDPTTDTLTFAHETHTFKEASNGTTNMNTETDANDEDNINIPDWKYDVAGHITEKHDHKYTLPFGFKTISTNGRGSNTSDNTAAPVTTSIVADTTQDELTINSGDKWIKIETDTKDDKITISHEIHTPTVTDKTGTDLNNPSLDTIDLQDIVFDAAGHMTENRKHTYTLPYGFKTIATAGTSTVKTSTAETSVESIIADSTQDTFNIDPGNSWIKITTDSINDKIIISHENADSTAENQTATTDGTDSVGTGDAAITYKLTPNFGDSISIPEIKYDKTGHISSSSLHGIKIPQGSYLNTGDSGVITGIGFTPATGDITSTSSFLGDVALGAYVSALSATTINSTLLEASDIDSTTSLSIALETLDTRIIAEEKARIDGILDTNRVFTVGASGDYNTLMDAINAITKLIPSTAGNATIKILSGTSIEDQVILDGKDAGWITIISESELVPVVAKSDWQAFAYSRDTYPLFYGANGAVLPTINTIFVFDKNSIDNLPVKQIDDEEYSKLVCGLCIHGGSKAIVLPNCGFEDFNDNIISTNESSVVIHTGIASGAWKNHQYNSSGGGLSTLTTEHGWGLHARHNGEISGRGCNLTNCEVAAYADRIADIDIREATVDGSNKIAQAEQLSRINANSIVTTVAVEDCIESKSGSSINLNKDEFNNWVNGIEYIKVAAGGMVAFNKCKDSYGGTMALDNAKSYCNIVLNTTTSAGIIYCTAEEVDLDLSLQESLQDLTNRANPSFDTIENTGIYMLKFTVDEDNSKTPEWINLEQWQTGGKY